MDTHCSKIPPNADNDVDDRSGGPNTLAMSEPLHYVNIADPNGMSTNITHGLTRCFSSEGNLRQMRTLNDNSDDYTITESSNGSSPCSSVSSPRKRRRRRGKIAAHNFSCFGPARSFIKKSKSAGCFFSHFGLQKRRRRRLGHRDLGGIEDIGSICDRRSIREHSNSGISNLASPMSEDTVVGPFVSSSPPAATPTTTAMAAAAAVQTDPFRQWKCCHLSPPVWFGAGMACGAFLNFQKSETVAVVGLVVAILGDLIWTIGEVACTNKEDGFFGILLVFLRSVILWIKCKRSVVHSTVVRTKSLISTTSVFSETVPKPPDPGVVAKLEDKESMNANTLANVDCDGDRSFPPSSSISENSRTNDALHFIYVDGLKRVPVNARPFPIDDDFFKGEFLPLFRCVDDVPPPEYNVEGRRAYQHFLGKKRMFEFQFQGKLKRKPEGNIWLAIEIDRSIKLGPFQRILIRAALGFVRRTFGGGFQYSLGDDWSDEDKICKGNYEKMHVAFTLHDAVDRLVVSRSGEALPDLGGNIEEDPDIVRRRKKKKIFRGDSVTSSSSLSSGWNTEDTYTLALWSAYIDFMSWRVLNLPGIRPFLLSVLIGNRPLTVSYYSLKKSGSPNIDNDIARPHLRKDINILSQYEIGHVDHTIGGYTQKYIDINKNQNGATMKKS